MREKKTGFHKFFTRVQIHPFNGQLTLFDHPHSPVSFLPFFIWSVVCLVIQEMSILLSTCHEVVTDGWMDRQMRWSKRNVLHFIHSSNDGVCSFHLSIHTCCPSVRPSIHPIIYSLIHVVHPCPPFFMKNLNCLTQISVCHPSTHPRMQPSTMPIHPSGHLSSRPSIMLSPYILSFIHLSRHLSISHLSIHSSSCHHPSSHLFIRPVVHAFFKVTSPSMLSKHLFLTENLTWLTWMSIHWSLKASI